MSWRDFHFPRARAAISIVVTVMGVIVSVILWTGIDAVVANARSAIDYAGYVPPTWLTAKVLAPWWWTPLILCFVVLLWGFTPHRKPSAIPASPVGPPPEQQAPTLHSLFESDFPDCGAELGSINFTTPESRIATVETKVMYDFLKNTKFVSFFVREGEEWVLHPLAESYREQMESIGRNVMSSKGPGDSDYMHASDAVFSGRVFIYYPGYLSVRQIADLVDAFKAHGATLVVRGMDYLAPRVLAHHAKV